jgi:hypothetical protein
MSNLARLIIIHSSTTLHDVFTFVSTLANNNIISRHSSVSFIPRDLPNIETSAEDVAGCALVAEVPALSPVPVDIGEDAQA